MKITPVLCINAMSCILATALYFVHSSDLPAGGEKAVSLGADSSSGAVTHPLKQPAAVVPMAESPVGCADMELSVGTHNKQCKSPYPNQSLKGGEDA